ncbi:alpha/beta fold hydrolase [Mesorhizobium sp. M6A.T.Ce.TU.016.01.1.1]|uniref:thioesterase domain-containing protein n=1 Tax=Mesorhizobium sp. M6A.T.Ce.TU.016.01.1.1 TaxID=2496783 RepID=UPI000FCA7C4E|nr:alpha/beta fold hydrolase [Mesorhizobium sp. M6A.T.Ce.TU.016.01.1.1]RUU30709.1 alpha/beta fold hydrolase [Mesorhizobium sp. M6A.T.Ce.TU.016.01.1.1]
MSVRPIIQPIRAIPSDGPAHVIAGIFATELQIPTADIDDSFFDLGGDSLTAETLVLAVQNRFGIKLQTSVLLAAPTPREFGRLVASLTPTHPARQLIVPVSGGSGHEPIAMIHGISGSALFANRFGKRLKEKYAVMAVRGMGLEPGETPYSNLDEISANYFEGLTSVTGRHPHIIGGICLGGLLAIEVGRLTYEVTGERPALLLIDPPPLGSAWLKPIPDDRMTASRRRQITRKVVYWRLLRDGLHAAGLGQTRIGRHTRQKAFKSALVRAAAGFSPSSYPCDILVLASSEWSAATVEQYRGWASEKTRIKTVVVPGTHDKFREANMEAIDDEIIAFLAARDVAVMREPASL